jgi:Na+-translocating ferredoxin:NAD+ oxidoreductase RnfD subunit
MRHKAKRIQRFFKTPKGLLTIILAIFVAIAAPVEGWGRIWPGLLGAILISGAVDIGILRVRSREWQFPSGAVLTATIVAMVLRVQEPWYIVTAVSVFAILTKYVVRSRTANVFNPAALAIIVSFYVFHTGQSWWGALPAVSPILQLTLLAGGLYITERVSKIPLVLAFLGAFYLLFTITAYLGDPGLVAEVYRAPDLQAAVFFATIILTDPPTSPAKAPDQVVCGLIVAVVGFAIFMGLGAAYYLLAGVLAGNIYEAWRRVNRRAHYRFPRGILHFLREIGPWKVQHRHRHHGRVSVAQ